MLFLSNKKTQILEIEFNHSKHANILKNCLHGDYDKYILDVKKGTIKFFVIKNLGFICVKITDKYFDLLGGIRSDKSKNAIKKTTPILLNYCKKNNLIFRVQSDIIKIKDLYMKFDGFKTFKRNDMNLIYKKV